MPDRATPHKVLAQAWRRGRGLGAVLPDLAAFAGALLSAVLAALLLGSLHGGDHGLPLAAHGWPDWRASMPEAEDPSAHGAGRDGHAAGTEAGTEGHGHGTAVASAAWPDADE